MIHFEEVVTVEPEFLRLTTIGKYKIEEMFDFFGRVKAKADGLGRNRVLIDNRQLEGQMTEAERFQGGQKIAEVFGNRIKLAILMPAGTVTKLGELTAVNRGARLLVTDCETEALGWVQSS